MGHAGAAGGLGVGMSTGFGVAATGGATGTGGLTADKGLIAAGLGAAGFVAEMDGERLILLDHSCAAAREPRGRCLSPARY